MKHATIVVGALLGFAALPKLVEYMAGNVFTTLAVVVASMVAYVTLLQDLRR